MVKLNKLINKNVISLYRHGFTWMKLKYFIQVNNLYLTDDLKKKIDKASNIKATQISISTTIKYKYFKSDYQDKLLKINLLKIGSNSIDKRLLDLGSQLETLFKGKVLESKNTREKVTFILLVKESKNIDYKVSPDLPKIENATSIKLSREHSWVFEKCAHLLLGGMSGSGKSFQALQILSELNRITSEIYVCDGKNDELAHYSKELFKFKNVSSNINDIVKTVTNVENLMNQRYQQRQKNPRMKFKPAFLIIDEYASLKLIMDKKEYIEFEKKIKNLVLKARASNIHLVLILQRASAENFSLDIRDNCAIKVGLGNLSVEGYKMLYGLNIDKSELEHKEAGQGYISINDKIKDFQAFNIII